MNGLDLPKGINATGRGLREIRIEIKHLKWQIKTAINQEKIEQYKQQLDIFLNYEQTILLNMKI